MGKQWKQWQNLFEGAPKSLQRVIAAMKLKDITPWKKGYYQPRYLITRQRHYLPTKIHLVKALVFPIVMYGCESWTVKKAEGSALSVHWKVWCWSWNSNTLATWCEELTHLKWPWCWERLKAAGEGDDRGWGGWHHQLSGHEFGWAPGVGDGQGGLACCSAGDCVRHDWKTELNWKLWDGFHGRLLTPLL